MLQHLCWVSLTELCNLQKRLQRRPQQRLPFPSRALRQAKLRRSTGKSRRVETPKRVKAWWLIADSDKVCMTVKYGAKVLEPAKVNSAIEIGFTAS